jgi:energy-coupling factor transporter ATP-binding protein EcfA2
MATSGTTVPGRPSPIRQMRRIGLWGAPGSGKTSFLAALNVAVAQSRQDWSLVGVDNASVAFLTESTLTLTHKRRFPEATQSMDELSWVMLSEQEVRTGGRWRKEIVKVPLQLHLDLLDAPGDKFDSEAPADERPMALEELGFDEDESGEESQSDTERLIDSLSICDGIVYLYDPVREKDKGDAYKYFQGTLAQIAQRALRDRRFDGNRLPHHLAVCITKFDEPRVYETANRRGYLTIDPDDDHMFPRVHEDSAEDLFEDLCGVSPTGSATLVRETIKQFFDDDRVRYFATSSVGFNLGKSIRFRASDYQNVVPDGNGGHRIRGAVHPINVLEPLLWLGQQITRPTTH